MPCQDPEPIGVGRRAVSISADNGADGVSSKPDSFGTETTGCCLQQPRSRKRKIGEVLIRHHEGCIDCYIDYVSIPLVYVWSEALGPVTILRKIRRTFQAFPGYDFFPGFTPRCVFPAHRHTCLRG